MPETAQEPLTEEASPRTVAEVTERFAPKVTISDAEKPPRVVQYTNCVLPATERSRWVLRSLPDITSSETFKDDPRNPESATLTLLPR